MEKPGVYTPILEPFKSVTEDLTAFIHRVALNDKASPSEIAALPAIAEVLYKYGNYGYEEALEDIGKADMLSKIDQELGQKIKTR